MCIRDSLYGDAFDDLSPREGDLDGCELVLVDLQDVGSRYYTFVWTAVLVMRAAAKKGIPVLVLDRPNPLGHTRAEGRSLDAEFRSFVGLEPVPVRHALTDVYKRQLLGGASSNRGFAPH